MAWAGTGTLCVIQGGVLKYYALGSQGKIKSHKIGGLTFVQISDSHMGFNKIATPDVVGMLTPYASLEVRGSTDCQVLQAAAREWAILKS
jgi:hypothetical protein